MRKVFVLVGLGGLAFGIYKYYLTQLQILELWDYRLLGGRVKKASFSELIIQLDVEITNDADITLTITDYYFDIYLNNVLVANVRNASVNQILNKNGGKSLFQIDVKIDPRKVFNLDLLSSLTTSIKESDLRMVGYFGIKKGLIKFKNIPYDDTYKLKEFM
jgi:LEA14-like dessication related protein